jgi:hypothetical protein
VYGLVTKPLRNYFFRSDQSFDGIRFVTIITLSTSKMIEKLITIFTCAVVNYPLPLLAEKVTVEKILDLSVFGNCNIYLKRFREDQRTVDLTEKLILVQQELRKDFALTCIDNATRRLPMASPSVKDHIEYHAFLG